MKTLNKGSCKVWQCCTIANNDYEKWQLDLCLIHLIDFMKWFIKDQKINAAFSKFCEIWEHFKDSNQIKTKNKIRKKIQEIQVYFDQQKKLASEYKNNNKFIKR